MGLTLYMLAVRNNESVSVTVQLGLVAPIPRGTTVCNQSETSMAVCLSPSVTTDALYMGTTSPY